ncbi:MAG: hypothetical protein ACAI35_13795, partial [Candidatus Methylacidiphilales bacterium]|nr:hypothetical protein [Candidatus Methylacidiphilales bacterium]
ARQGRKLNVQFQYTYNGTQYTKEELISYTEETKARVMQLYAPGSRHLARVNATKPDKAWLEVPRRSETHVPGEMFLVLIAFANTVFELLRRVWIVLRLPRAAGQKLWFAPGRRIGIRLTSDTGIKPALLLTLATAAMLIAPCFWVAQVGVAYYDGTLAINPKEALIGPSESRFIILFVVLILFYVLILLMFVGPLFAYTLRVFRGTYDLEADLTNDTVYLPKASMESFMAGLFDDLLPSSKSRSQLWQECHQTLRLVQCSGFRVVREDTVLQGETPRTSSVNRLELCLWSGEVIVVASYDVGLGTGVNWEGLHLIVEWLNRILELPGAPPLEVATQTEPELAAITTATATTSA